jgi:hypothetical protein
MKIALALTALAVAFVAGARVEEWAEWRTCRALSFFDQPASPALAQFKVHRPPERQRKVELVSK